MRRETQIQYNCRCPEKDSTEYGRESERKKCSISMGKMKVRKIFIALTSNLSLKIQVGVWQTHGRPLALVKRKDRTVGGRRTQADSVLGLS